MPISLYKTLHIIGILLLTFSLGSLSQSGVLELEKSKNPWHKSSVVMHGVALLLILLSGFGMLAKLGINWPLPGWVMVKLLFWLSLGYAVVSYKKGKQRATLARKLILVILFAAAILGIYKPF